MDAKEFQGWDQPLSALLDVARAIPKGGSVRCDIDVRGDGKVSIDIYAFGVDLPGVVRCGARVPVAGEIPAALREALERNIAMHRGEADKAEKTLKALRNS